MATVIRFVVLYKLGIPSDHEIHSVILGVGFTQGGHNHSELMDLYTPLRKVHEVKAGERVYAGYLHVDEDGSIQIYHDGGSRTLGIEKNEVEDLIFVAGLDVLPRLKEAIVHLYPLIRSGLVANMMLSVSQKTSNKIYG